ncbi:hypothetical protein DM872_08080 [Pseudomonas taiwanensis]|uniref:methyltransferase domain-containing protein n=1 Tax=Pseudomonas taiwanensis TaxID=470150 RepID=UPI0015BB0348|nr:methyltransferase domain-containing protein [Pseudomonas taiwanensis]NWL76803.1 hypothetical protein [Pseudomonas taiwanensis]
MEFTGERFVPSEQGKIRIEHYHRYALVLDLVEGKSVLDIACGEGYGSFVIASSAELVVGVDVSEDAIVHASRTYAKDNLTFKQGSASAIDYADETFDVVVSFETIEHLAEQSEMLAEVRRVLRKDGVLVISSPNRPVYALESGGHNEFHVKELDLEELDELLRAQFPAVRYLGQRMLMGSVIQPLIGEPRSFRAWQDDGVQLRPTAGRLVEPVYFIAICAASADLVPTVGASVLSPGNLDLVKQYVGFARWAQNLDEMVGQCRDQIRNLSLALSERDSHVVSLTKTILERDGRAIELVQSITERDGQIDALNRNLMERDNQLAVRLQDVTERGEQVLRLNQLVIEHDERLEVLNRLLLERDQQVSELDTLLQRKDEQAAELNELVVQHGDLIGELELSLQERDVRIRAQDLLAVQRGNEIRVLTQHSIESETRIAELARATEEERRTLVGQLEELTATLNLIQNSRSWRLTAPLRRINAVVRFALEHPGSFLIAVLRKIYHRLPVSVVTRNRLKGACYRIFPRLFSHTLSYKLWQSGLGEGLRRHDVESEPTGIAGGFEIYLPDKPVVSIVIPVYGQAGYTYRCLLSLQSHRSNYSFEVIVVDDCSTDDTLDMLKTIKGVRVVRNKKNLGFIRSCNNGAEVSRGSLLVMLNNDTVVRPGWLDELVETFNCIPDVGLVGSKLVYPDGRLQEAGGIIWQDGSAWNFGRMQDPLGPEFSYARDVDYCSGASIAISRVLYKRLGGFDEHFLPAYGEDSDLAFRVRQAGHRVVYQPLSEVVHFEGVTSGKEVTGGVKAYQVANAKKLFERWQSVMASHGTPGVSPHTEKDRCVGARVLFLDHCTPTPDQDAGSITIINMMRIFQALGFKVTFVPEDNFLYMDPYTKDLQRIGIECLYAPYVSSIEQHLSDFGDQYDVVVVFRMLAAERNMRLLRKYCRGAKIIFHTSDLHHLREMREATLSGSQAQLNEAERTKTRELQVIESVDGTIVHSTYEAEQLAAELVSSASSERIFLFPWAIDIPGTKVQFSQRNGLVFIGGYQHQPNVDAVLYFAKEIFPLIRARLPDIRFRIVGSRMPPAILALAGNGIEVVGYVADLREVLDRSLLSVVPLRYGAGIKGKIGTSLSYGLPCVSTTIGAEGMGLQDGDGVCVVDDPLEFAEAVVRLHGDHQLWESFSRGGLDYVQRTFSLQAGMDIVRRMLKKVGVPTHETMERGFTLPVGTDVGGIGKFIPDQASDPYERTRSISNWQEFQHWIETADTKRARQTEWDIISANSASDAYHLAGYCRVCEKQTEFLVDTQCGAIRDKANWIPNWRERLVCPGCGLNNRQRATACAARTAVKHHRDKRPDVYLMEQVTSIYQWVCAALPKVQCVGSEYLGPDVAPGAHINGIRHEDVERLSFTNDSFDLIISNDVLEHVVEPKAALMEAYRVLRPRGELLLTVPFHLDHKQCVQRARVINGEVEHILPPVFHGNPVSNDGSLVFTDFGWSFLQDIRNAGFTTVELRFYWSELYGHLGAGQHYIYAAKS